MRDQAHGDSRAAPRDRGAAASGWAARPRPSLLLAGPRPGASARRLVVFFAAPLIVLWIASFLPGGQEAAWVAWGTIFLVAVVGGRAATNVLECLALAIGATVGLGWGGLTQSGMPGGPSADEVISTSIVIGIVILIVSAAAFAFSAGGRALRRNVARARGQLGDGTRLGDASRR